MPTRFDSNPLPTWRLLALAVAVLLIVVGPQLLLRNAQKASRDSWHLVIQAYGVEMRMHLLTSDLRNLESAALTLAAGVDSPLIRERIMQSRERVEPTLLRVQQLTRHDPGQQERMNQLQSRIALRMERIDRLLDEGYDDLPSDLRSLAVRYPIHDLASEVVAIERAHLQQYQARADRLDERAAMAAWAAVVLQLLLLAGVLYLNWGMLGRRVAAEREAMYASRRASLVLDTVREPIVLVDGGLHVVMHNAAFAELYDVDDEVRGLPLAEVGNGAWQDEALLRRLADVTGRDRELWDLEHQHRTADGIERTMLVNARPMSLPDSTDEVALITVSDISAQKASERQIRELNQQLRGKVEQISDVNRELEAFSYSVSHDLRAPLRHTAGFSDKLRRHLGQDADEKTRHYLDVISGSARRMSELIDDLLVYSRLGRSALRLQTIDLQSMVEEMRAMLEANALADNPERRIDWRIAPLPVVVGDENMLRQVWLNLMGNALKYSRDSDPARIEIWHETGDDGSNVFFVRDNGAGFDMQYAGKLFGVFQRLHSPSQFSGTGIGLASVRRVVGRHGGTVSAHAEPGRGATFQFTLPAAGDIAAHNESTT